MAEKSKGKSHSPKYKKSVFSKPLFAFIAVILVIVFIVFSVFIPSGKKSQSVIQPSNKKTVPVFKDEGNLTIIRVNNSPPITLDIEIADDEAERMRGLMDRFELPDHAGMLFIFEREEMRSFWMKNTFISLDIIYINANKEIVSIQKNTQPQTTYSIPSERPARYVLEVNAGFTDKYEINPGDKIEFSY